MPVSGPGFSRPFDLVGQPSVDPQTRPRVAVNAVTPSYHATFGIRIVAGRAFTDSDRGDSPPVAIVNQAFVARFLQGRDAIGQRVVMPLTAAAAPGASPPPAIPWEVVGVQADAINSAGGRPVEPEIAVPFSQAPWPRALVAVRMLGESEGLGAAIAAAVRSMDPDLPIADLRPIEQTLNLSFASDRFFTVFIAAFGAVALLLAAIGIYGVMSFAVSQRTHEIGLRIALGGRPRQVLALVLREGMTTALAGMAIGGVGAALIGRALQGAVYGIESTGPLTIVVVAVTLLAAALIACLVPARRAAAVDPMIALRQP